MLFRHLSLALYCICLIGFTVSPALAYDDNDPAVYVFASKPFAESIEGRTVDPYKKNGKCKKLSKKIEKLKEGREKAKLEKYYIKKCMKKSVRAVRSGFDSLNQKLTSDLKEKQIPARIITYPFPEAIEGDSDLGELNEFITGESLPLILGDTIALEQKVKEKKLAEKGKTKKKKVESDDMDELDEDEDEDDNLEGKGSWEVSKSIILRSKFDDLYKKITKTSEGGIPLYTAKRQNNGGTIPQKTLNAMFIHFYKINSVKGQRKKTIYMRLFFYDRRTKLKLPPDYKEAYPLYKQKTRKWPWNTLPTDYVTLIYPELESIIKEFSKKGAK